MATFAQWEYTQEACSTCFMILNKKSAEAKLEQEFLHRFESNPCRRFTDC